MNISDIERKKVINRGYAYLASACEKGHFNCFFSDSRDMSGNFNLMPPDIGSSLLILETALKRLPSSEYTKWTIYHCKEHIRDGRLSFFLDRSLLPEDAETTAFGLSVLLELNEVDSECVHSTVDQILNNTDETGVIKVYFEPCQVENQLDHVSAANVLYLVYLVHKESEAQKTEDYVLAKLQTGEYLECSTFYPSPDTFLYVLTRIARRFPAFHEKISEELRTNVQQRIGQTRHPLDLAMRITSANRVGLYNQDDLSELLMLQDKDGSWPADAVYNSIGRKKYYGSKAMSTGFAVEALE